jgi:hypothetical protein
LHTTHAETELHIQQEGKTIKDKVQNYLSPRLAIAIELRADNGFLCISRQQLVESYEKALGSQNPE